MCLYHESSGLIVAFYADRVADNCTSCRRDRGRNKKQRDETEGAARPSRGKCLTDQSVLHVFFLNSKVGKRIHLVP